VKEAVKCMLDVAIDFGLDFDLDYEGQLMFYMLNILFTAFKIGGKLTERSGTLQYK
jgi:hypothetical protein